ncbi:MAG TPA: GNAT family N-acetyltransferase [Terracidiphilus sp.]|nr:GNAT family N-acetyltransferase [Terracidiphilus sp.]
MIGIRDCEGYDELEGCVQLQIETWGFDESDVIPRRAFRVAQKIGGQVIGAFDSELGSVEPGRGAGALVGFAAAWPGVKTNGGGLRPYLHSHMLAVRAAYRNRGLGAQLKRAQRVEALERGFRLMEWTFDPLEIKNAYLNIHRLGAVVSTYLEDFYGVSSSRLQGGLPTDRLVAEWRLDSARVKATLEGRAQELLEITERIWVPAAVAEWKATEADRDRALAVQSENRRKFQRAFSQGLSVLGFARDAEGNGVFELGPRPSGDEA